MKQFAFVDWSLVRSTPLKHAYRCGWWEWMVGGKAGSVPRRSMRRHITIEWDGKDQLTVRTGKIWPTRNRWYSNDVKSIKFGIRENTARQRSSADAPKWLWFIQLTGRSSGLRDNGSAGKNVLAEFLVACQHDAPSTSHARVPNRVQELLQWLGQCTGHRAHGPVLVTDEVSRKRILSNID